MTLTRNVSANALIYLKGLLLCRRRNCQVMAEELQESNGQRLHHFITASKWCYQQVMDVVTLRFWQKLQNLGLADDACLIIDEAGNPKKGKKSAGVKRQYCGQVGKIDNCQVGVFGALCGGSLTTLVQASLFGIEEKISKIDQAAAIIAHVIKGLQVRVRWVCFDAFYGRDASLLADLIKNGIEFIADVQDNLQVWLEPFQMRVSIRKPGARGRKSKQAKPNRSSLSIKNYAASLSIRDWKFITVRHQSGGKKLQAWFHSREVYILNPLTNRRQLVTLLIREDKDGTIKYSFCHCPGSSLKELAYRQCKRYFVEKAFREAKKELGLNQYQTRSAESWHKHMAMIMLAQLFLNEEKIQLYEQEKLWTTTQDVIQSLKSVLQFVKRSIEDFLDYILAKQPPDKRLVKRSLYLRI
ncbi:IS701 family transposase [Niastella populi]|uniref:IS701 family transposase n=1 Tax=Niastella populi TaxID=550983 RepID=UPI0013FDF749|nr:IS701 family transposase [Niastella populi]